MVHRVYRALEEAHNNEVANTFFFEKKYFSMKIYKEIQQKIQVERTA